MTTEYLNEISSQIDIGAQWIRNDDKEPYTVVGVDFIGNDVTGYFYITLISHNGLRRAACEDVLNSNYTHIPPMKGAYK